MRHGLRLFTGDGDADDLPPVMENSVSIPLGELLEIIDDARRCNRTWLRDFKYDEVLVSSDLLEVLRAYGAMRPGA
jgi:hypothetical protein